MKSLARLLEISAHADLNPFTHEEWLGRLKFISKSKNEIIGVMMPALERACRCPGGNNLSCTFCGARTRVEMIARKALMERF